MLPRAQNPHPCSKRAPRCPPDNLPSSQRVTRDVAVGQASRGGSAVPSSRLTSPLVAATAAISTVVVPARALNATSAQIAPLLDNPSLAAGTTDKMSARERHIAADRQRRAVMKVQMTRLAAVLRADHAVGGKSADGAPAPAELLNLVCTRINALKRERERLQSAIAEQEKVLHPVAPSPIDVDGHPAASAAAPPLPPAEAASTEVRQRCLQMDIFRSASLNATGVSAMCLNARDCIAECNTMSALVLGYEEAVLRGVEITAAPLFTQFMVLPAEIGQALAPLPHTCWQRLPDEVNSNARLVAEISATLCAQRSLEHAPIFQETDLVPIGEAATAALQLGDAQYLPSTMGHHRNDDELVGTTAGLSICPRAQLIAAARSAGCPSSLKSSPTSPMSPSLGPGAVYRALCCLLDQAAAAPLEQSPGVLPLSPMDSAAGVVHADAESASAVTLQSGLDPVTGSILRHPPPPPTLRVLCRQQTSFGELLETVLTVVYFDPATAATTLPLPPPALPAPSSLPPPMSSSSTTSSTSPNSLAGHGPTPPNERFLARSLDPSSRSLLLLSTPNTRRLLLCKDPAPSCDSSSH